MRNVAIIVLTLYINNDKNVIYSDTLLHYCILFFKKLH